MNCFSIGFVYALMTVDQVAAGPFFLSRPVIIGTAVGALLGNAPLGFSSGLTAELLFISLPSFGPAAVADLALVGGVSALWAVEAYSSRGAALSLSLALAAPVGWAAARLDRILRRHNDRFGDWIQEKLTKGRERYLVKALAAWSVLWFLKAWVVFAVAGCLGQRVIDGLLRTLPLRTLDALDQSASFLLLGGFAAALAHFWTRVRSQKEKPS